MMENRRQRNIFIDKRFQTLFILKFTFIVLVSSAIIGALLFSMLNNFTTVAIENTHVIVKRASDFILPILVQTILLVTIFSALSVIFLTLYVSHKIAGPLYRLRREIEALSGGNLKANFRTRKTDQLQDLANVLCEMSDTLNTKHLQSRQKVSELKQAIQGAGGDKSAIERKIAELEEILNYFRT